MFTAPRVSDAVIKKSQLDYKPDSSMHLKERGILRHMLQVNKIADARALLQKEFSELYDSSVRIRALLDALEFIRLLKSGTAEAL